MTFDGKAWADARGWLFVVGFLCRQCGTTETVVEGAVAVGRARGRALEGLWEGPWEGLRNRELDAGVAGFQISDQDGATYYRIEVFSRRTGERWVVYHRFRQFYALNKAIREAVPPAAFTARLPPKKWVFNKSPENLAFRVTSLDAYLRAAVRCPPVAPMLAAFLEASPEDSVRRAEHMGFMTSLAEAEAAAANAAAAPGVSRSVVLPRRAPAAVDVVGARSVVTAAGAPRIIADLDTETPATGTVSTSYEADPHLLDLARRLWMERRDVGDAHPRVATTLVAMADVLRERRAFSEASLLFKRGLVIREEALGSCAATADVLHRLAFVHNAMGNTAVARKYDQRARTMLDELATGELAPGATLKGPLPKDPKPPAPPKPRSRCWKAAARCLAVFFTVGLVWIVRLCLLAAATLRGSIVASLYVLAFVTSLIPAPFIVTPWRLDGLRTHLRVKSLLPGLLLSAVSAVLHVAYAAADHGDADVLDEGLWADFGYEPVPDTLEGFRLIAPDGAVLVLSVVYLVAARCLRPPPPPPQPHPTATASITGETKMDEDEERAAVLAGLASDKPPALSRTQRQAQEDAAAAAADAAAQEAARQAHLFATSTGVANGCAAVLLVGAASFQPTCIGAGLLLLLLTFTTLWAFSGGAKNHSAQLFKGRGGIFVLLGLCVALMLAGVLFQVAPTSWEWWALKVGFIKLPGETPNWPFLASYACVVALPAFLFAALPLPQHPITKAEEAAKAAAAKAALEAATGEPVDPREADLLSAIAGRPDAKDAKDVPDTDAPEAPGDVADVDVDRTPRLTAAFGRWTGFLFAVCAVLLYAALWPDILVLPLVLWAVHALLTIKVDSNAASKLVPVACLYLVGLILTHYAMLLYAVMERVSPFLHPYAFGLTATQGGFSEGDLQALEGQLFKDFGIFAVNHPGRRLIPQLLALLVLATHNKVQTYVATHAVVSPDQWDALSAVSGVSGVSQLDRRAPDVGGVGDAGYRRPSVASNRGRCAACGAAFALRARILASLLFSYSALAVLVVLYVVATANVSILNAIYMVFLVVFACSPNLRRRHWGKLVLYCGLVVTAVFVWRTILQAFVDVEADGGDPLPSWVLDLPRDDDTQWASNVGFGYVILILGAVQWVQYRRQAAEGALDYAEAFDQVYPLLGRLRRQAQRAHLRYGILVCYLAYMVLGLVPGPTVLRLSTFVCFFAQLWVHLRAGITDGCMSRVAYKPIVRLLLVQGTLQAVHLGVRYAYQLESVSDFVVEEYPGGWTLLTLDQWGLHVYSSQLARHLLDTVVLLTLSFLQARAIATYHTAARRRAEGKAGGDDGTTLPANTRRTVVTVDGGEGGKGDDVLLADLLAKAPSESRPSVGESLPGVESKADPDAGDTKDGATIISGTMSVDYYYDTMQPIPRSMRRSRRATRASTVASAPEEAPPSKAAVAKAAIKRQAVLCWRRARSVLPAVKRSVVSATFFHMGKVTMVTAFAMAVTGTVDVMGAGLACVLVWVTVSVTLWGGRLCCCCVGRSREGRRSTPTAPLSAKDPGPCSSSDDDTARYDGVWPRYWHWSSRNRPFQNAYKPIVVYAVVMFLFKYAFQAAAFRDQPGNPWYEGSARSAPWWGLDRVDRGALREEPTYGRMWDVLWRPVVLIILAVVQRWSHDFMLSVRRTHIRREVRFRRLRHAARRAEADARHVGHVVDLAVQMELSDSEGESEAGSQASGSEGGEVVVGDVGEDATVAPTEVIVDGTVDGGGGTQPSPSVWSPGSGRGSVGKSVGKPVEGGGALEGVKPEEEEVEEAKQPMESKADVRSRASSITQHRFDVMRRVRSVVKVPLAFRRLLRVNAATILETLSLASLLAAALTHLNIFSFIQVILLLVCVNPRLTMAAKRRLWGGLLAMQAFLIVYQALTVLGFPDFYTSWREDWPFTHAVASQYYYLSLGDAVRGFLLISDYLALMTIGLTLRQWRLDASSSLSAAMASADALADDHKTPAAHRRVLLLRDAAVALGTMLRALLYKNKPARPRMPAPASTFGAVRFKFASSWECLKTLVVSTSLQATLFSILLIVLAKNTQDLINIGYAAVTMYLILNTTKLMLEGNRVFWVLRVYNLVVLAVQVLYQNPDIEPGEKKCLFRETCLEWDVVIGLVKASVVEIPGAPACASPDGALDSNAACPSPWTVTGGLAVSIAIFLLTSFQAGILASQTFKQYMRFWSSEGKVAAWRQHQRHHMEARRIIMRRAFEEHEASERRQAMVSLIQQVHDWENVLLLSSNSEALPPPPPNRVRATVVSHDTVKLTWKKRANANKYHIFVKDVDTKRLFKDFVEEAEVDGDITSVEIATMEPEHRYTFKVSAGNEEGTGLLSGETNIVVMPAAPAEDKTGGDDDGEGNGLLIPEDDEVSVAETVAKSKKAPLLQRVLDKVERVLGYAVNRQLFPNPLTSFLLTLGFEERREEGRPSLDPPPPQRRPSLFFDDKSDAMSVRSAAHRISRHKGRKVAIDVLPPESLAPSTAGAPASRRSFSAPGGGVAAGGLPVVHEGHEDGGHAPTARIRFTDEATKFVHRPPGHVLGTCRRLGYLLFLSGLAFLSHTSVIVFIVFFLNLMVNQTLLATIPVIFYFLAIVADPAAYKPRSWRFIMRYFVLVVFAKVLVELPFWCMYLTPEDDYVFAFSGTAECSDEAKLLADAETARDSVYSTTVVGLVKNGEAYGGDGLLGSVWWELVCMAILLTHRFMLVRTGLYPWDADFSDPPLKDDVEPAPKDVKRTYVLDHEEAMWWPGGRMDEDEAKRRLEARRRRKPRKFLCFKRGEPKPPGEEKAPLYRRAIDKLPPHLREHYLRLINPEAVGVQRIGKDLFLRTALLQFVMLVVYLLLYPSASGSDSNFLSDLQNNKFNGPMVLHLMMIMIIMVLDRIAYSNRSHGLKLFLLYLTTIYVHLNQFLLLPVSSDLRFGNNFASLIIYLLSLAYMYLSAKQLAHGFSALQPEDTLKRLKQPYITLFKVYNAVPFLREIKQLLDYLTAPTSLDLKEWMKLESIATDLHLNEIENLSRQGRIPHTMPCKTKCPISGCWVCILVFVIIAPMLVFSDLNPVVDSNLVTGVDVSVSLHTTAGNFELFETNTVQRLDALTDLDTATWVSIRQTYDIPSGDRSLGQSIALPATPATLWSIPPSSLQLMLDTLEAVYVSGTATASINLDFKFERPGPVGAEEIESTATASLSLQQAQELHTLLSDFLADTSVTTSTTQTFPQLYPDVLRLPGSLTVSNLVEPAEYRSMTLQLNRDPGTPLPWWTVTTPASVAEEGLEWLTFSDDVPPAAVTGALGSFSIIAIYATVVMSVARAARDTFGSPTHRIPYEEMPRPYDLVRLVESVKMVQYEKYEGHEEDETFLYELLIRLYRSTDVLASVTRAKDD